MIHADDRVRGLTQLDKPLDLPRADDKIGEQQIGAEPGPRHALHLADGRAAEPRVARLGLPACELRALVRRDVWPQARHL